MPPSFIDEIFAAFAARGGDSYGEHVTQLDHALQCAWLAEAEGAPDHLIAAALLHDYGHLFEGRGDAAEQEGRDARHEAHGAWMLRRWFGPEVVMPIALHVLAKRYLCAAEPGYEDALSPASKLSLRLQGGRFSADQRRRFERSRYATDAIRLRRWDDEGKSPERAPPGLEHYASLLRRTAKDQTPRARPSRAGSAAG
jgi:phosphonate degradation associated HDIG domain protein